MAGICMCTQANCVMAATCWRFKATAEADGQPYFTADPRGEDGRCRFYWREGDEFTLATAREH